MKDAMTNIGDAKINRDALIRLYTARLDGKVSVVIDDHQVNVQKALEQFGWNSIKPINPMLDAEIARFSKEAYQLTAGNLIDLGNDTVGSTMNNLNRSFNNYIRPEAPPRYIAKEIVLETPLYKNQNLAGMWETLTDNERMRIEQTIRLGLSKGAKEADTIREVMKTFKLTRSHATGLVVTSTTSVYNQVDHAVYTANSAYLGGYQYISILDSRTTLICTHLDGRVFPISDISHRPPQHFYCRSTTLPVPKSWDKLRNLDAVKAVRNQNIAQLSAAEIEKYDIAAAHTFTGNTFEKLSYNDWLRVQPANVQLVHLGDVQKLRLFQQGQLLVDKFSTPKGASIGLRELKMLTGEEGTANTMGASVEGTSRTFELAKERLDSLNLGFTSPDELINKPEAMTNLVEYYKLQSGDLNGQLSLTNYRGILPHVKKGTKNRVLQATPTEEQLVFNPITKRREDARIYAPNKAANERAVRLVEDSEVLTDKDKAFILQVKDELTSKIGINETSVVTDNIRVVFERFRKNDSKPWLNLKAVLNTEMNHSLTNVSEYIETNLRNNADFFYKIKQEAFLDPILGATQLEDLAKSFHDNIIERNLWEVRKLPTIAWELKPWINKGIPLKLRYTVTGESRMSDVALDNFYVKFAKKLALDNAPDRDQLAVSLGRDLFTMANMRGSKKEWYDSGVYLLDRAMESGFYELETFGVKKRRMRSRMSGQYFGQYYDTFSQNIIIRDKRIKRYSYLNRAIDVGYRIGVNDELKNQMFVRPGYKTYFIKNKAGFYYDTRIPITSSSSFVNLPTELIDENMADAMNWYSQSQYKVDNEFHSFVDNMLNFRDDRGNAKLYEDLNGYKKYISGRSDSYERFKMMEYFKSKDMAFSNHAFIDHRGRFYDSGFIGPQSGETFRPFLNSPKAKALGQDGYHNIVDQVGGFLGGLSDTFEGQFNGLSQTGRVKIFEKYRNDLVEIGKAIRRNKPNDIRFILDHHMMLEIDPEDQGKFLRFALEVAKIDEYLRIPRGRHIANVTQALMDERVDVAGLARMLGVENKAVANYAGTPSEIIKSQAELIRLAKTGKISESDASNALKWLHTTDVELTKTRYERATYKTFDHDTGAPLSTAKIAENKEKFIARSKGNTRKYITTQVVEELGELLDEHLKTSYLKPDKALRIVEAQKRALKAIRFGEDTVIKDANSIYFGKTNKQAADIASRKAGLTKTITNSEDLVDELNKELDKEVSKLELKPMNVKNPYSEDNLKHLDNYMIDVALEQDASSSGAQIIALTTKNKQLAELSNVVPTNQKRRLYDEVAAATYDDHEFKELNKRLNISLKDLRKASKMHNMVTLYGAGQRTASLNVERKLAKALGKDSTILVVSTKERDAVLSEISARAAKVKRWDPETADDLMGLRKQVKDIFDKGISPDAELMDELWWLDPKSKDFVEKLSRDYAEVITPQDFAVIGKIMTKKMEERVPILNDFTKFFGRVAQEFLETAKPAEAEFDWTGLIKKKAFGVYKGGYKINKYLGRILGIDSNIPLFENVLKAIPGFNPNSTIAEILLGVRSPDYRPTGKKFGFKLSFGDIYQDIKLGVFGEPAKGGRKNWTQVPWVNFDNKVLEQVYTQRYEERLYYKDKDGNIITNIVQVDQKTDPTWFEELTNKDGKINDIADSTGARTAFAVNGNHSNDAVLVKQFVLWGKKNNIGATTIHDAFMTNAADMLKAKEALRTIYAGVLDANSVKKTLDLLRERGLPKEAYDRFLAEAIEKGIIPVAGKSRIGNKVLTESDILKASDILKEVPKEFWKSNEGFYGVG